MDYIDRLSKLMRDQNVSQSELGRRARIHQTHISRILARETHPTVRTLERLLGALGASIEVRV